MRASQREELDEFLARLEKIDNTLSLTMALDIRRRPTEAERYDAMVAWKDKITEVAQVMVNIVHERLDRVTPLQRYQLRDGIASRGTTERSFG